jgi:hypothetical protein
VQCSVAFAVLAAAQTAAAVALRQSFSSSLSEQDFFMCRTADQLLERGCSSGWGLREGMLAFAQLQRDKQLPVVEACRIYEPLSGSPCSRTCTTTLPQLLQGAYRVKPLGSIVEMQRHIRQQGSIVCRMQLYSDIRPFFAANRGGVYTGPGEDLGGASWVGRKGQKAGVEAYGTKPQGGSVRGQEEGKAGVATQASWFDGGGVTEEEEGRGAPHTYLPW